MASNKVLVRVAYVTLNRISRSLPGQGSGVRDFPLVIYHRSFGLFFVAGIMGGLPTELSCTNRHGMRMSNEQ